MQIGSASPTLLLNAILATWAQFCKDCYIISTCTPSCPASGTAWLWWLAWAGAWLCYPLMWLSIYNKEWDITVIQPISSTSTLELFKKALVDIWIDLYLIKFQFLAILCVFVNSLHHRCTILSILIKSPRSGLYVFSPFLLRPRPPAQKLFPLTSKPFELNLWYLAQRIYGSGELYWMTFPWPWPKVTAVASISQNVLVCTIKWEPLIGWLQNVAALLP